MALFGVAAWRRPAESPEAGMAVASTVSQFQHEQEDALQQLLNASLTRIEQLIQFAEAKNAALVTFSSAWLFALLSGISGKFALPPGLSNAFLMTLPLFSFSAIVSLISFIPLLSLPKLRRRTAARRNLLYFADIAATSADAYLAEIRTHYLPYEGRTVAETYINDLCVQIYQNSRVARRKFRLFNLAAVFVFLALMVLFLSVIAFLVY